jgi:hypothetical protein
MFKHLKEHSIHQSELLHFPYMDPIRFAAVDPMHCLFLGVAKWISIEQLQVAQSKIDHVELPSAIGHIPPKIAIGEGFLILLLINGKHLS